MFIGNLLRHSTVMPEDFTLASVAEGELAQSLGVEKGVGPREFAVLLVEQSIGETLGGEELRRMSRKVMEIQPPRDNG